MKVWVVERGMYSDRYVDGVWLDAEKAKASYPRERWTFDEQLQSWRNDQDFSAYIVINAMNVRDAEGA